jgi:hypothetical protein
MTIQYSTALRTFVGAYGSYKQALKGGVLNIYSGSVPASADAALVAGYTLLSQVSLASGTWAAETLSSGTVTVAGSSGSITNITVDGKEILGTTCTYVDSPTNLATLVAATINAYSPVLGAEYVATSSAAIVTITALPGTGTSPNALVVATTVTGSVTATAANMASGAAGSNGLTYAGCVAGVLSKGSGVWSGVNAASGTATYFRLLSSVADAGALSTTLMRIQGTCGISGADYNMSSTTLTSGYTHTVDGFSLTLPAA